MRIQKRNRDRVVIYDFVFPDGSVGLFRGFDSRYNPFLKLEFALRGQRERCVFDSHGNCFKIEIDTRKSSRVSKVAYKVNGKSYFHPIVAFYTMPKGSLQSGE